MDHEKLTSYYPWDSGHENNYGHNHGGNGNGHGHDHGQTMLFLDRESRSAEFTVVYMIVTLLKQRRRVAVLCTNHSKAHYESLIRKHTLDPKALQNAGLLKLVSVSVIERKREVVIAESSPIPHTKVDACPTKEEEVWSRLTDTMTWDELERWSIAATTRHNSDSSINAHIGLTNSSKGGDGDVGSPPSLLFDLVVDDLTALEVLSPDNRRCRRLIKLLEAAKANCIQNLVFYDRETVCRQTVIDGIFALALDGSGNDKIYSNEAVSGSGFDNGCSLSEYCKYKADIIVTVAGLPSGYSLDIHGSITVQNTIHSESGEGSMVVGSESPNRGQVLLFKALDTGVKVYKSNKNR